MSLEVTFIIWGQCGSLKGKREEKQTNNWQSSRSKQRTQTYLLCRPSLYAAGLFCNSYWDFVQVFARHVTSFVMVLQTTFPPRGVTWPVNLAQGKKKQCYYQPRALREKGDHVFSHTRSSLEKLNFCRLGPNMKTSEPKRCHPLQNKFF